eukprot:gene7857-9674_t
MDIYEETSKSTLESTGIEKWLVNNLHDISITQLFPVQQEIVPFIMRTEGHDICVCAPTGSGKTLAYSIPLVQKIFKRVVRRIRIAVIVPTHDLVSQVEKTFKSIIKGTDLVVESLGIKPFHHEQKLLVKNTSDGEIPSFESLVDIIVSTPGRLVDHISETPGFSLKYLNYLVIDEADRLLRQSFHDWLERVMDSTSPDTKNESSLIKISDKGEIEISETNFKSKENTQSNHLCWNESKLVKLLLSATMTYNPSKISLLQMNAPLFFTTSKIKEVKYSMPNTLKECYVLSPDADQRPLVLLNIIKNTIFNQKQQQQQNNNQDSTRFIGNIDGKKFVSKEYSSALSLSDRSSLLEKFKKGEIDILICSDIMSRGMDISDIDVVINYNPPPNITLYVHRVGRTARAGKDGPYYQKAVKLGENVENKNQSISITIESIDKKVWGDYLKEKTDELGGKAVYHRTCPIVIKGCPDQVKSFVGGYAEFVNLCKKEKIQR